MRSFCLKLNFYLYMQIFLIVISITDEYRTDYHFNCTIILNVHVGH